MSIYFHEEDRKVPGIDKDKIVSAVNKICELSNRKAGDINFIFCSDEYLINMNRKYLEHDYYTDIITFDYNDGEIISGDIFMSRDRIEDNAKKYGEDPKIEFVRNCGHGVLHLLGQGDASEEEKELMREKEDQFIKIASQIG